MWIKVNIALLAIDRHAAGSVAADGDAVGAIARIGDRGHGRRGGGRLCRAAAGMVLSHAAAGGDQTATGQQHQGGGAPVQVVSRE